MLEIRISPGTIGPNDWERVQRLLRAAKRHARKLDVEAAVQSLQAALPINGYLKAAEAWVYPGKPYPARAEIRAWFRGDYDAVLQLPADYGWIHAYNPSEFRVYLTREVQLATCNLWLHYDALIPPEDVELLNSIGVIHKREVIRPAEHRLEVEIACPL